MQAICRLSEDRQASKTGAPTERSNIGCGFGKEAFTAEKLSDENEDVRAFKERAPTDARCRFQFIVKRVQDSVVHDYIL